MFQNGWSWGRGSSPLAGEYILETDRTITPGNGIDRIRTNGFNTDFQFNQNIRKDIKDHHRENNCVILGLKGTSENTKIEIDHKAGSKDCERVSNVKDQRLEDFQPLSKAANDAKRQFCKECRRTGKRYDAKKLGYPVSFYYGDENHNESEDGCIGCFWYDPIEFRKHLSFKG